MVDINDQVYSILNGLGYPTYYQYPLVFNTFPCISYFDSGHTADDYKDGKANVDVNEITVDVWEKPDTTTGIVNSIHAAVDDIMQTNGFYRIAFVNQYEENTLITHYTMKYNKPIEEVN